MSWLSNARATWRGARKLERALSALGPGGFRSYRTWGFGGLACTENWYFCISGFAPCAFGLGPWEGFSVLGFWGFGGLGLQGLKGFCALPPTACDVVASGGLWCRGFSEVSPGLGA